MQAPATATTSGASRRNMTIPLAWRVDDMNRALVADVSAGVLALDDRIAEAADRVVSTECVQVAVAIDAVAGGRRIGADMVAADEIVTARDMDPAGIPSACSQ